MRTTSPSILSLFLLALLLMFEGVARAQYTWTNIDGAITITGYTGPGGPVTIPAAINGLPVTAVGGLNFTTVFAVDSGVTSVTIPHGVLSIGTAAFVDCAGLTNVVISDSVTNIGGSAFNSCGNLTAFTVDPANPAFSSQDGVLFNKQGTTLLVFPGGRRGNYVIPGTVNTIGVVAFRGCLLTGVTLPDSVTNIEIDAFEASTNLVEVTIPRSVTVIGAADFYACLSLKAITVDPANPAFSSVDGILYDKHQTTVWECPGAMTGNLILPNTVTNIGDNAFANCPGVTGVLLPASVNTLQINAFTGCSGLTNMVIPGRVTSIGDGAFSFCTRLSRVTLGNGVTNIGELAFADCPGLSAIALPAALRSIGTQAFQNCLSLTSVSLPSRLGSIGQNVFYNTGLTSLLIASGITNLAAYAFADCASLTNVVVPGTVITIGVAAFANCGSLASVTLSNGVRSIGSSAFSQTALGTVTIPVSVTNIGVCPFGGVPVPEMGPIPPFEPALSPEEIALLTEVESQRLSSVSPISPPVIPPPVLLSPTTNLTVRAALLSPNLLPSAPRWPLLTNITVAPGNSAYASVNGVLFDKMQTTLIEYPDGLAGNYTIPGSVWTIGTNAFEDSSYLADITIPNSVAAIGDAAFAQCTNLTSVTIPGTVTQWGDDVFQGCYGLTNVIMGNGIAAIGNAAFEECTGLASVVIPDSVTSLGSEAFEGCYALTNAVVGNGVTGLAASVFWACSGLTSVTMGTNVSSIGTEAFFGCSGLTNIFIPPGVTNIGSEAFSQCFDLAAITVDPGSSDYSSVDGVLFDKNQGTLFQCPQSKRGAYTVPGSVTNIAAEAFSDCYQLTSVTLPAGLVSVGDNAFSGCNGLTSLTIPGSVAELGNGAFADCALLADVFFQGNAPATDAPPADFLLGEGVFTDDTATTVEYAPGTTGWGITYGGVPAVAANSPAGSLQVQVTPSTYAYEPNLEQEFAPDWQLDGGIPRYGAATVTGLAVGSHTVTFADNTGWTTPASETVTIVAGQTTLVVAAYLDDTWPTNQITQPIPNQRFTNDLVTIGGSASAPLGVAGVFYQLNDGGWTLATTTNGWTNWSANVSPAPGTNILRSYAVDTAGRQLLYAGDSVNNLIRRLTTDGQTTTLAGDVYDLTNGGRWDPFANYGYADGMGGQAQFNHPNGTAVDGAGNVYVADTGNNLIRKITPSGLVTTLAGDTYDLTNGGYTAGEFVQPNAGRADGQGGAAQFNYPCGIAVDGGGNVYVADADNNLIRKITPAGMVTTLAGDTNSFDVGFADGQGGNAQFDAPYGVAVDSAGNVIVADSGNNVLRRVTPDGWVTTVAGDTDDLTNFVGSSNRGYADGPAGASRFYLPTGVAVDGFGNIFVSDSDNNLIRQISVAGQVTTLAGDTFDVTNDFYQPGAGAGFGDGSGSQVRFHNPGALATDIYGNVYVDDCNNDVVRKITPTGQTSTLFSWGMQLNFGAGPGGLTLDGGGGNFSLTNTVVFDYVAASPLQIQMAGMGTISPDYSNAVLVLGANYRVTAQNKAGSGFVFTHWIVATNGVGGVINSNAALSFTMVSNLTLTAVFADVQKPTDTIANLSNREQISSSVFTVTGVAGDNAGVAAVWYQLNNGSWTLAASTNNWTNWSADLSLAPGANTLRTFAVDTAGQGTVYVADTGNNVIREILPNGAVTTLAGSTNTAGGHFADGPSGTALFSTPTDTAVDRAGSVYVADLGNNCIRKVTPAGLVTTLAGDTNAQAAGYADGARGVARFNAPASLALDGAGNVYVADAYNNLIRKITPAGLVTTLAGDTNAQAAGYADGFGGKARFNNPYGIALDGAGNVYVGDLANNLIRKITPAGLVTTIAGDTFDLTNGGYNVQAGTGYADGVGAAAKFSQPEGVAVDPFGNILVADALNGLIREISPAGVVTTLAGDVYDLTNYSGAPYEGYADGPADQARFWTPTGVAADDVGDVFVADVNNSLIREITAAGIVTTLAGDTYDLTNEIYNAGDVDGFGAGAKFNDAQGLVVNGNGANFSPTNTISFESLPSARLQLQIGGVGAVAPNYSNALLVLGNRYSMTAETTPGSGYVFGDWSLLTETTTYEALTGYDGSVITNVSTNFAVLMLTNGPTLSFVMASLTNIIVTNETSTLVVQGTYLAQFVDVQKPVVSIVSPTPNQLVTGSQIVIHGTARDNAAVAGVWCQFNGGGWFQPTGTNNWSVPENLNPGTNTFMAYAVDTSGNISATNTVNFVFVSKAVLSVMISGGGSVAPNYNGASLQIGQNYTMTAKPAAGFAFANWSVLRFYIPMPLVLPRRTDNLEIVIDPGPVGPLGPPAIWAVLTNQPTLVFAMEGAQLSEPIPFELEANFVDIAPPTVAFTTPTPNLRVSNTIYTVTGTARDNVGVATVWYNWNGGGWQEASTDNGNTNWYTQSLPLLPGATNTVQAYAVDTTGNISTTNTVSFVNLQVDPAPASVAGSLLVLTPTNGGTTIFALGTNTFSENPTGIGLYPSVGEYIYTKLSADSGELLGTATAPPAAPAGAEVLDLHFSSPHVGTFYDESSGNGGTFSLERSFQLAPTSVAGRKLLLIDEAGVESTVAFGGPSLTVSNAGGTTESMAYDFAPYSPIAGLITAAEADGGTNYVIVSYLNMNWGLFNASSFDAAGNATGTDAGEFVFPTNAPAVPGSLTGQNARVSLGGGATAEFSFGSGIYSETVLDPDLSSTVGDYGFARLNATNFTLTLSVTAPPNRLTNGARVVLDFVAPDFAVFTNQDGLTNTVEVAGFLPGTNMAPPSLAGRTIYATNANDSATFKITCGANSFTQVEAGSTDAGTSSGTYAYKVYSPLGALLTLKYAGPAALAGSTDYLQAVFEAGDTGFFSTTFYDRAGDPPSTGVWSFTVQ